MSITLAILAVILICSSKISRGMYDGYIERRQTQAINGIFIILVFLRHFNQYVELNGILDAPFLHINSIMGQLIVTTFMFYSGYGVMHSILEKGSAYVDGMLKNRMFKTLVLFDIAILLYVVINIILDIKMTALQIILAFIGWSGVGNSTWYIFAILMMYLLTYLVFKFTTKTQNTILSLVIVTVLIAGYILIIRRYKDSQYYNTVFCYAMGLWYAHFKPEIDALMTKKNAYSIITSLTIVMFLMSAWLRDTNLLVNQMYYLLFVAIVVLVSMKVKIDSPVLNWCGQNLLGLYILQRLPMIALQQSAWMLSNPYVYFVLCVIFTVCLTIVYRHIVIDKVQILFKRC